jgi:peptidoglycan L-alanyl-D-glutamate endopeptidase CwlK
MPVVNSRSLDDLLPQVKTRMIEFIAHAELELGKKYVGKKIKVVPTCTLRDREYQEKLYAQGRTAPGKIVTNARPGDSIHEYACAMDYVVQVEGVNDWGFLPYYHDCGRVAQSLGLVWGGDWNGDGVQEKNDWDLCHVQWTGGLTLADLKAGKEVPLG